MLFSNFDFLQQNFAVISKTFLDNSDSAIVSVLSHSWPPSVLLLGEVKKQDECQMLTYDKCETNKTERLSVKEGPIISVKKRMRTFESLLK